MGFEPMNLADRFCRPAVLSSCLHCHNIPDRIRTCICTIQKTVAYPLDYWDIKYFRSESNVHLPGSQPNSLSIDLRKHSGAYGARTRILRVKVSCVNHLHIKALTLPLRIEQRNMVLETTVLPLNYGSIISIYNCIKIRLSGRYIYQITFCSHFA